MNENIRRGYPNPDYTEEDLIPGTLETTAELILDDQLVEHIQKSALFDCLASAIKLTGKVDDDLVKAITGNLSQEEMVPKKEADNYWGYYMREQQKSKELEEKVASLEHARMELTEIIKQNHIGPYAETAEGGNG